MGTVDGPYLLLDQKLKSWLFVKAVDSQGNERISVLEPVNVPFYVKPRNIIIFVIVGVLLLEIWRRVVRRKL